MLIQLDIQSCTFDSKHTKKEITRIEIQKQLANDRALQESLLKERRINLNKINNTIFDEEAEIKLNEIKQKVRRSIYLHTSNFIYCSYLFLIVILNYMFKEKELQENKRQEKLIDIERLAALEKLELEKIAHEKRKLQILKNR